MPVDPVCGMVVDSLTADAKSTYDGKTVYFCSHTCKSKFDQEPGRFRMKAPGAGWAPIEEKKGFLKKLFSSK